MPRDLHKVLTSLADESRPINHQLLRNLSDLTPQELEQLRQAWPTYSPTRRRALIQTLVDQAEEQATFDYNTIFAWAMEDGDARIRMLAIDGLWEARQPRLLSRFIHILYHDEDVDVRAAAAMAVGRFVAWAELAEIPADYGQEAIDALWDVYHNPREHVHVRRRALEGLASSSHPGVPRLLESAQYDQDPHMRASALYGMGRTADERWITYLLPHLESDYPEHRMEAARALGELEAKAAVDPMIRMLDHEEDMEVRFAILEALGQIGGEKAKKALQVAANSENDAEAEIADLALEELLSGTNALYDLINEVLGIESALEGTRELDEEADLWSDDFYEDPLDAEIRRLLDEDMF